MRPRLNRRTFLEQAALLPGLSVVPWVPRSEGTRLKLSCNLYSFNGPLRRGEMTLAEVFEFCAALGFDAVDPTGYYFPGYPQVPADGYLFELKKKAHRLGLALSGTGVRNDFTVPDPAQRAAEVALVKAWVDMAAKLGAPVVRVFDGKGLAGTYSYEQRVGWVVECLRACAAYGESKGVLIVLQNHHELAKTAGQILQIREWVGSDWLGLNVDVGSLRMGDPYAEIARLAPYAATWQLKESVYRNGTEEKTDLRRVVHILAEAGYRGYLPLETLTGDPRVEVPRFLAEVREALAN